MDVMKNTRTVLLRAATLAGILVVLTLAINVSWFDEALHPDLVRLMPAQPVSMDGNAYPLIYGLLAADYQDPRAAGLAVIQMLRDKFEAGERTSISSEEMAGILGGPSADEGWASLVAGIAFNARFETDCADRLIAEVTALSSVRLLDMHAHPNNAKSISSSSDHIASPMT